MTIGLPLFHSGKVRDMYSLPNHKDLLLMVASDRLSTHNVVHVSLVPQKGELLTALSVFWAITVLQDIPNHLVAWGKQIYEYLPKGEYSNKLHHRAVIVQLRKRVTKVEFIYRDYLVGSLWQEYRQGRDPYRLRLRPGLPLMYKFPSTVFTPTEKSKTDDPIPYREVEASSPIGAEVTREVFLRGRRYLAGRGITLIDAKAEVSGRMLVDEWLNGDCSRMAWTKDVRPGEEPPFLDKEPFRQQAIRQWGHETRTPLTFTEAVLVSGIARYHEAFEAITGTTLEGFQKKVLA